MDKKGPGSLRDLGSFKGPHPPFIDLTLMSRRGAVHCLYTYRWPRLETGPRIAPIAIRRMPGYLSVDQRSALQARFDHLIYLAR